MTTESVRPARPDKHRSRKGFALVTGASSGIGLAYARQLAARGYDIVAVSDRPARNEEVAAALRHDRGVEAFPLYADLSQPDSADRIYGWCRERGIEIEILVSNAGILHFAQLARTAPADIDRIAAIHCTTPAKLCRLFAADMCRRGRGYILLMSSVTAWTPYPTMSLYGATKAFLKHFGQSLWFELHDRGVSVTTVFPGAVDTPLYELDAAWRRRLLRTGIMLSADNLAGAGLKALFRRRRRCIPGMLTQLEVLLCRMLPARVLLPLLRIPPVARRLEQL